MRLKAYICVSVYVNSLNIYQFDNMKFIYIFSYDFLYFLKNKYLFMCEVY